MAKKRILSKYDGKKYGWFHFALEFVIGIIVCLLIASFIVGIARVDGNSMLPTLENNQRVIFLKVGNEYQVGKIVAIKMPSGDKYVKRIVALPGDEVDIHDGAVFVNGKALEESYVQGTTEKINAKLKYPIKLEQNQYFVLGDNRGDSVDSRTFGPVIIDNIKGSIISFS